MPETTGPGPSTNRRRLRAELRQLREEAGLPQALVAEQLDWSVSKLTRVENGAVGVSVTDVRALLGLYKAAEQTVDQMVSLARRARERRWWDRYRPFLNPGYQEFIGLEADASRLRQCHPTTIPGLLQTVPYMEEIMGKLALSPLAADRVQALIEVRVKRQEQVLGGDDPTPFDVVVDEAALRRPVGGAATMRAQLEHLAALRDLPSVSLSVLPFAAGPYVGMSGAFHIIEFADPLDQSMLYVENAQAGLVQRDDQVLVHQYGEHLERMAAMSLRGAAAVDKIRAIARDL